MVKPSIMVSEVFLAIVMLLIPASVFNQQLSQLVNTLHQKIGVTFYFQLMIITYVFGGLIVLILERQQVIDKLKHLNKLSDLCLLMGMIGTYIALINGIQNGMPSVTDLSHTFYSTLLGLFTVAFTAFFSEILRYTDFKAEEISHE